MEPDIEEAFTGRWWRGRPASEDVVQELGFHPIAIASNIWPQNASTAILAVMRATQPPERQGGYPNNIASQLLGLREAPPERAD
eukprot:5221184-Lingulodinium_polyedra.AAC.1